jgi:hypothetical protein
VALQNYEVGSTVATPEGTGTVVKYLRSQNRVVVHSDDWSQPFDVDELEGYAAGELSPAELDQWLEEAPPRPVSLGVETRSVNCSCPCGTTGSCYVNVRAGVKLMHFVNGGCRCPEGNCGCVAL